MERNSVNTANDANPEILPGLTTNAIKVLQNRYLKKDELSNPIETPEELFRRVARVIARVEREYEASEEEQHAWEDRYFELIATGQFMPNSPTLMNAGREMGMLSACFVLPVEDSIDGIFDSVKATALIQKAGGGTGFAFDALRPTGDYIASSGGTTSGPISFWRVFSEATNAIQQGAFRRGANMGMMYIHHPDILKFIYAKQDLNAFTNYNISVKFTDEFMEKLKVSPDAPHIVVNPRNKRCYYLPRSIEIKTYQIHDLIPTEEGPPSGVDLWTVGKIFGVIVDHAWETGEPGVAFIDRINEDNPTPHIGRIEATNPCGEQPLLPFEACNLGSVNVGKFVKRGEEGVTEYQWDELRRAIHLSTRFLDNVIDANNYPLPQITDVCHRNRKIGLGIMGFADALYQMGIRYNSDEGIAFGEKIMKFVNDEAHVMSEALAEERGKFPNWEGSIWDTKYHRPMRNACATTVAPTGTISIIANCSGGIEPLFSLAFYRNIMGGQRLVEVNQAFKEVAEREGFYSEELMEQIAKGGSIQHIEGIPEWVRHVFVCAHDVGPEWHIKMQAAFQRHCDSSISKTTNFPENATKEDVRKIYEMAYDYRLKGVTVYRDGCRKNQPMALASEEKPEITVVQPITIKPVKLPIIMSCLRVRQVTPFGNMHVKICVDPATGKEYEVFAQLGKGGDLATSDLEAICRLISLFLRCNGCLDLVLDQLEGIGSSLSIPSKEGRILSLADGLTKAVKKYLAAKEQFGLENLLLGKVDFQNLSGGNGSSRARNLGDQFKIKCPECNSNLIFEEGCVKCHDCGFSQC